MTKLCSKTKSKRLNKQFLVRPVISVNQTSMRMVNEETSFRLSPALNAFNRLAHYLKHHAELKKRSVKSSDRHPRSETTSSATHPRLLLELIF